MRMSWVGDPIRKKNKQTQKKGHPNADNDLVHGQIALVL